MMLNDYKCAKHGVFEASHPICGAMGCDSSAVEKVFMKAPGFKSDLTKRTDDGFRKSAAAYGQSDWKTSRPGEVAKANNRAHELKWGDEAATFLGKSSDNIAQGAIATEGNQALSLVTAAPVNPLARAERTMESKRTDDQNRAQLVQAAREATAK